MCFEKLAAVVLLNPALATLFETETERQKLSRLQFHFTGLLGTSPMSKEETKFSSIIGHQR